MTIEKKNELIAAVTALLERMIPVEETEPAPITVSKPALPEMLTVKECSKLVTGLTEHTIRMFVKQDKVRYIRYGEGARGKILVSKESLICQRHRYCKKIETVLFCPVHIITSQSDHG